jgi:hypothetical protein
MTRRSERCQDCDCRATRVYRDGRDGRDGVAYVCALDGAYRDRQRDEFYDELDKRNAREKKL